MAKHKTNYTASDIVNIENETLAGMLNSLGKEIEQLETVSNYRQQLLDKANACIKAVSAVLEMMNNN